MRGHTKTALGIDIGKRRVSVALVEKSGQNFRVLAAAGADLPTPAPQSPEPAYGRVLSRLLARLGWRSHVRRARASLALSPDSLVIQLLDMPRRMPANLGDFVGSELQQYVALSGKTVVSDFCGIGSGVQKRLLAVGADGAEIQKLIEVCSTAVAGIDTVEPGALAYARAFLAREKGFLGRGNPASGTHPPAANRAVLIAVLGPHALTTTVFRRETLDLVRVREIPAEASTLPLLCRWLAEELKAVGRYYDMQVPPSGHDYQVCLAIHNNTYRADDIAPLLAAEAGKGPGSPAAQFRGWEPHQTRSIAFGSSTKTLTVVDVPCPMRELALGDPVSLVAVGAALALLGTEGDDLRINLLPRAVTEARSLTRHVLLTMIVAVSFFLAIFATTQLLTRTTGAMNRRIEDTRLTEELYTASALIAEEKFLDQEIVRLRRQVEPLRKILKGRQEMDWPEILRAVREATPEGVLVTQLQCSNGRSASLRGLALSCPTAEVFVRNLEAQKAFASVSLTFVQRRPNEDDRWEYRIDGVLAAKAPPSAPRAAVRPGRASGGGQPS